MEWYYTREGQQAGPIDEAELCRLAQQRRLNPDDLVWNPTLGDQWVEASSIENLFASASLTAPRGSTHNRDLIAMARESLRSHWGLGVGVMLLFQVILQGVSSIVPYMGSIAYLILAGPMSLGLCLVFLSLARRKEASVGQLFNGFNRFGIATGAYLLMTLFILLWSLLFLIPGIIASYAYSMTFFIIADDPSVKVTDAITRSKEMMRGNKWKLFCLYCRFIGWALLCLLTFGIGYLWLAPYMQTAATHFYEDVK